MKTVLSLDHIGTITSINSLCPITLIDIPVSTNDNVQLLFYILGKPQHQWSPAFPSGRRVLNCPRLRTTSISPSILRVASSKEPTRFRPMLNRVQFE